MSAGLRNSVVAGLLVATLTAAAGFGALQGFEALAHHVALAEGADAAPMACVDPGQGAGGPGADACAPALTDARWSTVLGVPVAAWAAGLHLVIALLAWVLAWALAFGREAALGRTLAWLAGLGVLLLVGTGVYLYVGLTQLATPCPRCMAMHALAGVVVATITAAAMHWRRALAAALRRGPTWASLAGVAAVWVGAALVLSALAHGGPTALAASSGATVQARFASAFAEACAPEACPEALLFRPDEVPGSQASLVLAQARGDEPVLVELLDLDCHACQTMHEVVAPTYRELVSEGRAGLRLVLWSRTAACNPHIEPAPGAGAQGGDACAANAALICAHRHAGAEAALDYIEWAFDATPGYYTAADRRRWLERHAGEVAGRCFDVEVAMGGRGTLGLHADWAQRMRLAMAGQRDCDEARLVGEPWWCFDRTPSFGVFRATMPATLARDADVSASTAAARGLYLSRCME